MKKRRGKKNPRVKIPRAIAKEAKEDGVSRQRVYQRALEEKGCCRACGEPLIDGKLPREKRLSVFCGACLVRHRERMREARNSQRRNLKAGSYTKAVIAVPAPPRDKQELERIKAEMKKQGMRTRWKGDKT